VAVIVNPPIVPEVAVIEPEKDPEVAVIAPVILAEVATKEPLEETVKMLFPIPIPSLPICIPALVSL